MKKQIAVKSELFLLKHPFYQAWVDGKLSLSALQDYAEQYYHHVDAFPHYLKNALSLSSEENEVKKILSENLAEEDGTIHGTSHPELWLRFAEGVGATRDEVKSSTPRLGIQNVVQTFTTFSQSSLPEALGSLYAYESQVPEIAHSKIEGLQKHFKITDSNSLSFFEVHKHADIDHRNALLKIIENLSGEEQEQAQNAVNVASQSLWNFLTDVYVENQVMASACKNESMEYSQL